MTVRLVVEGFMSETASFPVLNVVERRILGVLVEKAKTTPDAYPLSINALITGCNQKSNREPVLSLSDVEVEDALPRLQKLGLVTRISGNRVDRWRHDLYETWKTDKIDLALLCELLLRGAQTEGELRSHVGRMESFADLDALRSALKPLTERKLVVYLTPQGRRGTALTHGFHPPQELDQLRLRFALGEEASPASPRAPVQDQTVARLEKEVADLKQTVALLTEQVDALRKGLGMS